MIPKKIESLLYTPHRGLFGVLLQPQLIECLVQDSYGFFEFAPYRGENENVIHVPEVFHVELLHAAIQIEEIECPR